MVVPVVAPTDYVVALPLQIYNLIDQKVEQKVLKVDIGEVPNLCFIQSLISKI